MHKLCLLCFLLLSMTALNAQEANTRPMNTDAIVLNAESMQLSVSTTGFITSLRCGNPVVECLPEGHQPALLILVVNDKTLPPVSADFDKSSGIINLQFENNTQVKIKVEEKSTHLTFELVSLEGVKPERIEWGSFPTIIGKIVGETVAVVRDDNIAIGLQALNIQTIGGAAKTDFGSQLSAVAIEHDGGVLNSKIALFSCPASEALDTIGEIELAEGLPHPILDGQWGKVSRTARLSYLICPFGEDNLDAVLGYAKQAGFEYIYHPGPFTTWGHFILNAGEFPRRDDSLKACVERAREAGIRIGLHTLTGFITTNDPYVSPVPDPRLARVGTSTLTEAISSTATEIPVASPKPFTAPTPWEKPMRVIIMGTELTQYESVSTEAPWRLLGCTRGVFGTTASAHEAGSDIGKLADHAYNTLYPGIENGMMDEMADRIVKLWNYTGVQQISFDGLEGLSAYGYGEYSRNRFVKQCYDGWEQETISDASNLLHYLWHIHTRMNWGEPWGRSMREGMAEYRFANQDYFERNLFPRMLGWFEVRPAAGELEATSIEDVEWMLAKAAGYDAGFAITTYEPGLRANGLTPEILTAVREWEHARMNYAFTSEQCELLCNPYGEFHLEQTGENSWILWPQDISKTLNTAAGQTETSFEYANPFSPQPLGFTLRVIAGRSGDRPAAVLDPTKPDAVINEETGVTDNQPDALVNPSFTINGVTVTFPVTLAPGQYLVCDGSLTARIYDMNWNLIETVQAQGILPTLASGSQSIGLNFTTTGDLDPTAQIRFKSIGEPQNVGK